MEWVLSVVVLVALALIVGAVRLWRQGVRDKPVLMVVLAIVMLVNAFWGFPKV
jgi:hypothetical protein